MNIRLILVLVVPALLAADPPRLVDVRSANRPLSEVANELGRAANVRIEVDRSAAGQRLNLNSLQVPFWTALEQIAQRTNQKLTVAPQGPRVTLGGGPYEPVPLYVTGPFRFASRTTSGRIDQASGRSTTDVVFDVVWEPKFRAFYAEIPAGSVAAVDNRGAKLTVAGDGSGKMDVKEFGHELSVRLHDVPRAATTIARLTGKLSLIGTWHDLTFRFDPTVLNVPQKQAGVTATLTKFKKAGRIWTADVELEYPKGPEFESFQSYLRDNKVWLERADGTKFPTGDLEIGAERQSRTTVSYRFVENEKDGFVVANPKDWKLVLRTPGPIVEITKDFELKEIRLP